MVEEENRVLTTTSSTVIIHNYNRQSGALLTQELADQQVVQVPNEHENNTDVDKI
jgi:predicted Rossmann fold nucleotide-binding protein DprA/Smf involved in DNA uptake